MSLLIGDDSFLINKDKKKIVFLNLNSVNNYIENENITYNFQFYLYHDQLLKYYKYNSQEKKIYSTMINNTSSISFNNQPQFSVVCFYNNKDISLLYQLTENSDISLVNEYVKFIINNIKPIFVYLKQKNLNKLNIDGMLQILINKSNLNEELHSKFEIIVLNIKETLFDLYMTI